MYFTPWLASVHGQAGTCKKACSAPAVEKLPALGADAFRCTTRPLLPACCAYENMCARACHDPDARIRVPNPVRACRQRVCRHLLPGPDALRQRRLNFWRQREAMALSLVLLGASLAMSATAIATKMRRRGAGQERQSFLVSFNQVTKADTTTC